MAGFGFMALVWEFTPQRLYNPRREGWGGTPARNRTETASAKSKAEDWVGQKKILRSMSNEILPFPRTFAYIQDWAFCLTAVSEHVSNLSSGRDDPFPSLWRLSEEELVEVALLASRTARFNTTHHSRWNSITAERNRKFQIGFRGTKEADWHLLMQNPPARERPVKRAQLEEHMSRSTAAGMKYKIFWASTRVKSCFWVYRLPNPYGIKLETAYILNLCIVIIPVFQLGTSLFLGVVLSSSCSLSLGSFQIVVTLLHIIPVGIQAVWVMCIDREDFWRSCPPHTVKKANEIHENGQDMPRSIHTSNKRTAECMSCPQGPPFPPSSFS